MGGPNLLPFCTRCSTADVVTSLAADFRLLKPGYQTQCPNCIRLVTFDGGLEDPNIKRPLRAARAWRTAQEEALVLARMAAQAPKREPFY